LFSFSTHGENTGGTLSGKLGYPSLNFKTSKEYLLHSNKYLIFIVSQSTSSQAI